MLQIAKKSLAEQFVDAMGNDGQRWQAKSGLWFSDVLHYISPWGIYTEQVWNTTRHVLADGSAIVECSDAWDIEHSEYRFWMACADPNDADALRHERAVEQAGYGIRPSKIDCNFSAPLTEEHLLFRRILEVAMAAKNDDNSPGTLIYSWLHNRANGRHEFADAAFELAGNGTDFGASGELGGINVYDERGDGTDMYVEWTCSDDSTWCGLGYLLIEGTLDDDPVPNWFDQDWVKVRDANNKLVPRGQLEYMREEAALRD